MDGWMWVVAVALGWVGLTIWRIESGAAKYTGGRRALARDIVLANAGQLICILALAVAFMVTDIPQLTQLVILGVAFALFLGLLFAPPVRAARKRLLESYGPGPQQFGDEVR